MPKSRGQNPMGFGNKITYSGAISAPRTIATANGSTLDLTILGTNIIPTPNLPRLEICKMSVSMGGGSGGALLFALRNVVSYTPGGAVNPQRHDPNDPQ